jgi:CDGSH-type Zn-finger protein
MRERKITVTKDGPYLVTGSVPLAKEIIVTGSDGIPVRWQHGEGFPVKETYILCRCGHSKNKPFCDSSHVKAKFDGTETAKNIPCKDQAITYTGPGLILDDAEALCAVALFCHRAGDTWTLTERSQDLAAKETAIQEACDCPSGRLVARDPETGKAFEPEFTQSIGLIEDPGKKISGSLWVKGRIPVQGADGKVYEVRNRVTLCRCGHSKNKPFCDGTHTTIGFKDGDPSVE